MKESTLVSPISPIATSASESCRRWPSLGMAAVQELVLRQVCLALDVSRATININSNFTELGGHSLSAIGIVSACKSHGVSISVVSILLSENISEIMQQAKPMAASSLDKHAYLQAITPKESLKPSFAGKRGAETSLGAVAKRLHTSFSTVNTSLALSSSNSVRIPMTEMQLSLVGGGQANPGTNVISLFETYQTKDIPLMKRAWTAIIESEPIFRTSFDLSEGNANLVLQATHRFSWTETVVHDQDAYDRALEEIQPEVGVNTSFKVITWHKRWQGQPLSTIIWRVHHALIDGYSATLIYKKLHQFATGLPIYPGTPFAEVARELQDLQYASRHVSQRFWKLRQEEFQGAVGDISLPPPSTKAFSLNATKSVVISLPSDAITAHARQSRVSLASMHHAAWALILSMYSDSESVVFGVVLSGRDLPLAGAEDAVGPLINTLPLHVGLNTSWTTTEYLRYIFNRMVELNSVQFSRPEDGYTRQFSSALTTEFEMTADETGGIKPIGKSYFTTVTEIPLSVFVAADNTVRICYHCNAFNKEDIKQLGEHYRRTILALSNPLSTIGSCMDNMLTSESRNVLRRVGNCLSEATVASSIHDDLVTLFERATTEHPEAVAVEKADQRLTYRGLNSRADRIAEHLKQFIQPGEAVCVNADRSINWIISIYGILKAGGVYSPQDKALPPAVRDSNFQSAGAKVFLVSSLSDLELKPISCQLCFAVEELLPDGQTLGRSHSEVLRKHSPRPSANAYICFTSGSTGKPKGVVCTHEGLVAFQKTPEVRLFAEPGRKISQIMSPAFDGSIHEIFSALSYGATLVLSDSMDPFSHLRLVDTAILTPSIAKMLVPDDFPKLSTVYLVGEPVPQYVNDLWSSKKTLYNMYGPTEATCGATIQKLAPGRPVSIGAPNPSTRIYILDRERRLAPRGVVGEIYLAGVQVARGYIGRPEETAGRFLADNIFGKAGEKMYRTGDRGYWNSSGEVQCLGRRDRQIKLRGYRLDLNDLEIRIAQGVPELEAVAIAQKDDYLVAMVQPLSVDVAALRSKIAKVLQVHALPRIIAAVDEFPMTPIGKVDYKAITATITNLGPKPISKASSSHSERLLISAWREALGLSDGVSIDGDSNFVALGGHSIAQLLLVGRLSALFGCQIPLSLIIQAVTLRDLAQAVDELKNREAPVGDTHLASTLGNFDISPMEREWWQKYEADVGSSCFNVSLACALDKDTVDIDRLEEAWNTTMARHRILYCRYVLHRRLGVRRIWSDLPPRVRRVQTLDVRREINRPFQLHRDNAIRVTIADDRIVAVMSHIICDLTTLQILLREVHSAYIGERLPSLRRTYMETTLWSKTAPSWNLDFWSKYLKNAPSCSYGLASHPDRISYDGASRLVKVPVSTHKRMMDFTATHKFTPHQMALATAALALQIEAEDTDVMLGGPYLNRPTAEDLQTVGLFLEPLPIRIRHSPDKTASSSASFLRSVQESSQSALSHAVPWTQLVQHMKVETDLPNHPILETMVTFHGDPNALNLALPGLEPLLTWAEGSKFKLLIEFSAVSEETLLLRLEHDTNVFSRTSILRVEKLILEALDCLLAEMPVPQIKARLRQIAEVEPPVESEHVMSFGTKLKEL